MLLIGSVVPALMCSYSDNFYPITRQVAVHSIYRRKASLLVQFAEVQLILGSRPLL